MYDVRKTNHLVLGICLVTTQLLPTSSAAFEWICGKKPLEDDAVDISKIKAEDNSAKTIVYTTLIYGRATADIMEIPRSNMQSLAEMEAADTDKGWLGVTAKENEKKAAKKASNLVQSFHNSLKSSDKRLRYDQKAFHYKALRWLAQKLPLEQNTVLQELKNEVNNALEDPKVAEEYFQDLIPNTDDVVNAEAYNNGVNAIYTLKQFANNERDKTIETFQVIQLCGIGCLQKSSPQLFKKEIYEVILRDSDPTKFQEKFNNYEPFQILMYMDYGFGIKKSKDGVFTRIPRSDLQQINFCGKSTGPAEYYNTDIQGPRVHKFKYALLFHYQILDDTFWQQLATQDHIYELIFPRNFGIKPPGDTGKETYSEAFKLLTYLQEEDDPKELRMKGLATLYLSILHEVDERMMILKSQPSNPKTDKFRMVYDKLLQWLSDLIPKVATAEPDEENSLEESAVNKVEKNFEVLGFQKVVDYITKIRDREARENTLIRITKQNKLREICNMKNLQLDLKELLEQELPPEQTTEDVNPSSHLEDPRQQQVAGSQSTVIPPDGMNPLYDPTQNLDKPSGSEVDATELKGSSSASPRGEDTIEDDPSKPKDDSSALAASSITYERTISSLPAGDIASHIKPPVPPTGEQISQIDGSLSPAVHPVPPGHDTGGQTTQPVDDSNSSTQPPAPQAVGSDSRVEEPPSQADKHQQPEVSPTRVDGSGELDSRSSTPIKEDEKRETGGLPTSGDSNSGSQ